MEKKHKPYEQLGPSLYPFDSLNTNIHNQPFTCQFVPGFFVVIMRGTCLLAVQEWRAGEAGRGDNGTVPAIN